eukprot:1157817-Pelagomonas_calceolata.AAC.8
MPLPIRMLGRAGWVCPDGYAASGLLRNNLGRRVCLCCFFPRVHCWPVSNHHHHTIMFPRLQTYAFPRIRLPARAVEAAAKEGEDEGLCQEASTQHCWEFFSPHALPVPKPASHSLDIHHGHQRMMKVGRHQNTLLSSGHPKRAHRIYITAYISFCPDQCLRAQKFHIYFEGAQQWIEMKINVLGQLESGQKCSTPTLPSLPLSSSPHLAAASLQHLPSQQQHRGEHMQGQQGARAGQGGGEQEDKSACSSLAPRWTFGAR